MPRPRARARVRLTVLGNASRYLAPLSAGTGYLVEHGEDALLLDCGPGVRAAPALADALPRLRAVALTHRHFDHLLDLVPVAKAAPKTHLLLPPLGRHAVDALADAYAFEGAFDHPGPVEEVQGGWVRTVGAFTLRSAWARHSVPALAWRVEAGGRALVYAGDGAPADPLRAIAKGCDALLCHTLLPTVEAASPHAAVHATAETAGRLAADVGAKRLLLSHRFHEEKDATFLAASRRAFHGPVELLFEGSTLEV